MRDRIRDALKRCRADYADVRVERIERTFIVYRGKALETVKVDTDVGGVVRCLVKKRGWGVVSFNSLDDLSRELEQALACALAGETVDPIELAPTAVIEAANRADLPDDFRGHSLGEKVALAKRYNAVMLGHDARIVDTRCIYFDRFQKVTYANSEGSCIETERPRVQILCQAHASDGNPPQVSVEGTSAGGDFGQIMGRDDLASLTARQAVAALTAKPVRGGRYPVVVDPKLTGTFIHEAFGHLSEADQMQANPKMREMMRLGRQIGRGILNVFDDGTLPGMNGTEAYDDEGVPAQRVDLIKNGVLCGRLHSRETAAKLSEAPTGNARALDYRFPPIVRMRNTAIAGGETSFADMIKDIRLGVYACDSTGGNTALDSFSFSAMRATMIRDGELAEPVKDVLLAGNLFETMMNIDAVGDDFSMPNLPGGCGKWGQVPLPVNLGGPHIRIQDVVMAGR